MNNSQIKKRLSDIIGKPVQFTSNRIGSTRSWEWLAYAVAGDWPADVEGFVYCETRKEANREILLKLADKYGINRSEFN